MGGRASRHRCVWGIVVQCATAAMAPRGGLRRAVFSSLHGNRGAAQERHERRLSVGSRVLRRHASLHRTIRRSAGHVAARRVLSRRSFVFGIRAPVLLLCLQEPIPSDGAKRPARRTRRGCRVLVHAASAWRAFSVPRSHERGHRLGRAACAVSTISSRGAGSGL
jgi:hypothetical protein